MGLQDLLASLVLLDRMVSQALKAREVLLVRKGKEALLASQVLLEVLGLLVPLVLKVSKVNAAVLVVLVLLASLVVVAFLVLLVTMVTQVHQGPVVLQAKTDPQVHLVAAVLLAALGCQDQKVMLANQVRRDHPAPRAPRELQAHLELQGLPEPGVLQDHQACQDLGEALDHRASRVKMGNRDLVVTMENVVLLDPRVFLVWPVQLVNLEEMEIPDQMVCQAEMELLVARGIVVKTVLLVPLVLLVTQARQALSVQLEKAVTEEKLALLALLVLQVLLAPEVLLVPKAHVATKVKQVNVVLMASKDIEDSLVIQVPQVLQVLLVTKVQSVAQDLQAPGDLLDPVGPLAKMEQVGIQVPLGHQGLEVTEVKEDLRAPQDTQASQGPLAPPVPLAHVAVEVGLLPSLAWEVKRLVVLPHTMEMNQWISKSTPKRL